MTPAHSALPAVRSIRTYLNPELVNDAAIFEAMGQHLRAGRLIIVRDAFRAAFADRLHACLEARLPWELHQKYDHPHFHFHHHNLYDDERYPGDLRLAVDILRSSETKEFVQQLTGRDCAGHGQFSASWYRPGDYSLPHTDLVGAGAEQVRQVAMVCHLTKDWQPGWGGDFYWCQTRQYVPPSFNTLLLFALTPESDHFVTVVSPHATGRRLALNGWWTGRGVTDPGQSVPMSGPSIGRLVDVI